MGAFLFYILKSSVCLFLFTLLFITLLRGITFFRFNRWAFWVGTMLCLLLPLFPISVSIPSPLQQSVMAVGETLNRDITVSWFKGTDIAMFEADNVIKTKKTVDSPQTAADDHSYFPALYGLYLAGASGVLLFFFFSFIRLWRVIHSLRSVEEEEFRLIICPEPIQSFSWWKYIVISNEDYQQNSLAILKHEKMHLRYHHTLDLLWMHCLLILHWFNPMVWVLWRELRDLHEYEADEGVIGSGINMAQYQLLLVKKAVGTRLYSMANGFDHSKLKNRIGMMLKKRSNGWVRLRVLLVVPVVVGVAYAFAQPEMSEVTALEVQSVAQDKKTQDIAFWVEFFRDKQAAWWDKHTRPDGSTAIRQAQVHKLYINPLNEILLDDEKLKESSEVRKTVLEYLRSSREKDKQKTGKDAPHFIYMIYNVKANKQFVLNVVENVKLAYDDLRVEYSAKGVKDIDEVCPYAVDIVGPRKYADSGLEILIKDAEGNQLVKTNHLSWNELKSYQKKYGRNVFVSLRADNSTTNSGYKHANDILKKLFTNVESVHEE